MITRNESVTFSSIFSFHRVKNIARIACSPTTDEWVPIKRIEKIASPVSTASEIVTSEIGELTKRDYTNWQIKMDETLVRIPTGKYDFVKIGGTLRVIRSQDNVTTFHDQLSQDESIWFAGQISFDEDGSGEIVAWDNYAPGYNASPELFEQAGLPRSLFRANTPNIPSLGI